MKKCLALSLFLISVYCLPLSAQINGSEEAITPVYEGETGILEKVIRPNCLGCHSSTLQGGQRNGAPEGVNYDTFAGAKQFGDRIVQRAVKLMTMPPRGPIGDKEKQALKNWMMLGFPENTMPPHYITETVVLELPEIFIIDTDGNISTKATTEMKLIAPFVAPFRFEIQQIEVVNLEEEGNQ